MIGDFREAKHHHLAPRFLVIGEIDDGLLMDANQNFHLTMAERHDGFGPDHKKDLLFRSPKYELMFC